MSKENNHSEMPSWLKWLIGVGTVAVIGMMLSPVIFVMVIQSLFHSAETSPSQTYSSAYTQQTREMKYSKSQLRRAIEEFGYKEQNSSPQTTLTDAQRERLVRLEANVDFYVAQLEQVRKNHYVLRFGEVDNAALKIEQQGLLNDLREAVSQYVTYIQEQQLSRQDIVSNGLTWFDDWQADVQSLEVE